MCSGIINSLGAIRSRLGGLQKLFVLFLGTIQHVHHFKLFYLVKNQPLNAVALHCAHTETNRLPAQTHSTVAREPPLSKSNSECDHQLHEWENVRFGISYN